MPEIGCVEYPRDIAGWLNLDICRQRSPNRWPAKVLLAGGWGGGGPLRRRLDRAQRRIHLEPALCSGKSIEANCSRSQVFIPRNYLHSLFHCGRKKPDGGPPFV